MSFKSRIQEIKNKIVNRIVKDPFVSNEGGYAEMLKASIVAVVALVVIVVLGSALLPGVVTTLSNTTAITGYSTWATGTQAVWGALSVFVVLVFLLILVAILLSVLG